MKRFAIALVAYAVLAVLALTTLSDKRIRVATLAVLALFAVKTCVRRKDANASPVMGMEDEGDAE